VGDDRVIDFRMSDYFALGEGEEEDVPGRIANRDESELPMQNLDSEIPVGPAYARDLVFWRHIVGCVVIGSIMGAVAFFYLEAIEKSQAELFGEHIIKPRDVSDVALGSGSWLWLLTMTGTGLIVGFLRVLLAFPKNELGFFSEVKEQYVNPKTAPKTVVISLVSLCGGSSLGPEAAMGALGGGIAQAWSERVGLSQEMTQRHVINGMAGAMGALFPSPLIAVTVMIELGRTETIHKNYMRTVAMMTFASSSAFAVFFALNKGTYLPFNPLSLTYHFHSGDQLKAALIGIVSGIVALAHILIAGLCKKFFNWLSSKIPNAIAHGIIIPTIGGFLIGLIAMAVPLTIGSGSTQTSSLLLFSFSKTTNAGNLVLTSVAKSVAFGISKGTGFVGGAIFPMIFVGSSFGLSMARFIDDEETLPVFLADACFSAAVPSALAPMPISFLLMIAFTFQLGAFQSTPIFVAIVTAHLTTCGFGLILQLLRRNQNTTT